MLSWASLKKSALDIAHSASWLIGVRMLRQLLSLAVVFVLVRAISKDAFGYYSLVVTLMGILSFTALPAMQRAVIQSVARGHEGTFKRGSAIAFACSFVGGLILLIIAGVMFFRGETQAAYALAAAALIFPFSQGLNNWQSLQMGRGQFKKNSIRLALGYMGSSASVLLAALSGVKMLAVLIAANFGILAIQNILQHRISRASIRPDATTEPGSLSYGLKASGWDMLNLAGNYCDRLFVFTFLTPTALAVYAAADRIPEIIKDNTQQLLMAAMPRFARQQTYTRKLDWTLNAMGLAMAAVIIATGLWIIPIALPLLYTKDYSDAVLPCQIITFSVAIGCFASLKNAFIQSKLDIRAAREVTLWVNVVRLISSALLTWKFGMLGAAASTVLYRISTFTTVELYIRRHYYKREP